MGYRSTFVSSDTLIKWPAWFKERYKESINFSESCISSKFECKMYGHWAELLPDIQRVLNEQQPDQEDGYIPCEIMIVVLHEDGLVDHYTFTRGGKEPAKISCL